MLGGGWVEGEQCMFVTVIVVVAEKRDGGEQWVNKKGCSLTDACMWLGTWRKRSNDG